MNNKNQKIKKVLIALTCHPDREEEILNNPLFNLSKALRFLAILEMTQPGYPGYKQFFFASLAPLRELFQSTRSGTNDFTGI